jgi:hypothetical protein
MADEVQSVEIRCIRCAGWFDSPIYVDPMQVTSMYGNTVDCPHCGAIVPCNKENMRVKYDDGGFRGVDT